MRSLKLMRTGMLTAALLLPGCGTEGGLTGADTESLTAPGLQARVEDAGHNAADHFKIDQPVAFEIESPCNGELIAFSGRETGQLTLVDTRENLDAGFAVHSEHQGRLSATGTGSITGPTYAIRDAFHESFNSPSPPAPQFTFSFHETLRVTSSVTGLGFSFRRLFHALQAPSSDEFKVTQDIEEVTCRG